MTLPAGITTCTVTIGKALGSLGEDASLSGTLTLDRRLVWSATGDTLYGVPSTVTPSQSGGWLSFIVAHVDQAGFVDQSGNSITGFSYTFSGRATFADGSVEPIVKHFQVFVGQSTLDLDLLPDGPATLPVVTPNTSVYSIAGLTGVVTQDQLEELGLGGGGSVYGPGEGPLLTSPNSAAVRMFRTNNDGTLVGEDTGDGPPPITDNFNRADSGVLDAPWEQVVRGIGIVGNQVGPGTGFGNFANNIAVRDCGSANGMLTAVQASDYVGQSLVFRWVDSNNYLWVGNGSVRKVEAGVETGISVFGVGNGNGHTMGISLDGDQIGIYNGADLVQTITESFNQDATKHGIQILYSTDRIDNFSFVSSDPPVQDTYVTETAATTLIADGARYNPQTNVYNAIAPSGIQRARAARARAEFGTDQLVIGVIADSMGDGNAHDITKSWPEQLHNRLVAAGLARANSFLRTSHTFYNDTRVVLSGYALYEDAHATLSTAANDTITSTFTVPGTIVDVYYWDKETGSTFTIAADGATSGAGFATVTTTGTGLIKKASLTGLSSAAHTVVVKHTNTVADYQIACEARIAGPGVRLLNYSIAAQGMETITAVNWNGQHIGQLDFMLFEKPDVVFIEAGGNNLGSPLTDPAKASYTAGVQALRTAGIDVILVAPHPVLETSDNIVGSKEVQALVRSIAVSKNCVAVDLHDRYYPTTNEDLGFYADALHLSGPGDLDASKVMFNLLSS